MLKKIIEVERDFSQTDICEICFSTSQKANLYRLNLGYDNNGVINKRGKTICSKCLKELKEKLDKIY